MTKEETLRGRGSFQQLYRSGKRIDAEVLRCFFRWETGAGTHVRAGFSVSAKAFNAVKRNRARRIMRASFDEEKQNLSSAARNAGGLLTVLFVYRGEKDMPRGRARSENVRKDIGSVCRRICATIEKERQ